MPLGGLTDDREAQPGPGQRPCRVGTVEAIEDALLISRVDTGPAIGHHHLTATDRHLDRSLGRVELAGVVEQARDRTLHRRPLGHDRARHRRDLDRSAAPALVSGRDVANEVGEVERLERLIGVLSTGHRDDLVDEVGQLLGLGPQIGDDGITVVIAEVRVPLQRVEVGAEAGERCAQLVTGILHQATLVVLGSCECGEHAVEGGGQPADLVVAGVAGVDVELPGALDVFGSPGQPAQ